MHTRFVTSPDGTPIAYGRSGRGPALLLVHGGGGSRQEWHEAGYVRRLQADFTVITLDLRGHGQSGLRTDPAAYTTDRLGQDILAVADACGVERFAMWGMSYGGGDFRCPTLWLIGSKDPHALASLKEYEASLPGSRLQVHVVEGLDHSQVFDDIDRVFPALLAFTRS